MAASLLNQFAVWANVIVVLFDSGDIAASGIRSHTLFGQPYAKHIRSPLQGLMQTLPVDGFKLLVCPSKASSIHSIVLNIYGLCVETFCFCAPQNETDGLLTSDVSLCPPTIMEACSNGKEGALSYPPRRSKAHVQLPALLVYRT